MREKCKHPPSYFRDAVQKTDPQILIAMTLDGVYINQASVTGWRKFGIPKSFYTAFAWARAVGYEPGRDGMFEMPGNEEKRPKEHIIAKRTRTQPEA